MHLYIFTALMFIDSQDLACFALIVVFLPEIAQIALLKTGVYLEHGSEPLSLVAGSRRGHLPGLAPNEVW
jgi:hypothetical protein